MTNEQRKARNNLHETFVRFGVAKSQYVTITFYGTGLDITNSCNNITINNLGTE
jgi:ABC-type transporter lipoprotein component MlaA